MVHDPDYSTTYRHVKCVILTRRGSWARAVASPTRPTRRIARTRSGRDRPPPPAPLGTRPMRVVPMAGCTAADTDTARERAILESRLDNARSHSRRMYEAWHDARRRLAHACPEQVSGAATAPAP